MTDVLGGIVSTPVALAGEDDQGRHDPRIWPGTGPR